LLDGGGARRYDRGTMAEGDDRRVTARTVLVGSGMGTTPERIADIERRAAALDKIGRKPTEPFAGVLSRKSGGTPKVTAKRGSKRDDLPKRAPRQKLGTASQRAAVGREDDDDPFIVKG
jgi:hypothetical protein